MPSFYVDDVDIDVDEFLSACSEREREDLIKALIEDGYLNKKDVTPSPVLSVGEEIFEEHLNAIHGKWHRLTPEEEEVIIKIGKKFIYEN